MKEFSLVNNKDNYFTSVPDGLVIVYGYVRNAVAYLDYDGNADRPIPGGIDDECFPLARDRDSVMAWHGQRKWAGNIELVPVSWKTSQ